VSSVKSVDRSSSASSELLPIFSKGCG